ncbi:unnamed protein product [Zymoseptoria tritici ST99CH_3D7]|uniref:Uncharacterized protein n=1 Tax=Zymoseptoria tritici (strain ST99CH_3D7) TaxID=1276538 RepID=A0A1X7RCE4_ZYMT9|nr:unnamed protein product [Zymoseptoria tritici ST99CH_3D7]
MSNNTASQGQGADDLIATANAGPTNDSAQLKAAQDDITRLRAQVDQLKEDTVEKEQRKAEIARLEGGNGRLKAYIVHLKQYTTELEEYGAQWKEYAGRLRFMGDVYLNRCLVLIGILQRSFQE